MNKIILMLIIAAGTILSSCGVTTPKYIMYPHEDLTSWNVKTLEEQAQGYMEAKQDWEKGVFKIYFPKWLLDRQSENIKVLKKYNFKIIPVDDDQLTSKHPSYNWYMLLRHSEENGPDLSIELLKDEIPLSDIKGKIIAVSINEDTGNDELVMINIGRDKDVKPAYIFGISKDNRHICMVEIKKVFEDSSVGQVISGSVTKDKNGNVMRIKQYDKASLVLAAAKKDSSKGEDTKSEEKYGEEKTDADSKNRIENIINQFPPIHDGVVLKVDAERKQIVINLGKKENLKPGRIFEVFQVKYGGEYVAKGLIKVIEVRKTESTGQIIKLYNDDSSIHQGDYINSPLYEKHRKIRIYLAGKYKIRNKEEYSKLIEDAGAIVVDRIGIYTDYVVLGHKDIGTAKQEAIDMGVVLMDEDDLSKYLKDKKKETEQGKTITIEIFAKNAPFIENAERPYPAPVPDNIEAELKRKKAEGETDHLGLLFEYGLRVHWKYLIHTKLARELPIQKNMMLSELVRIAEIPKYTSAHEAGWLNSQFNGTFTQTGWSSYQIYIWAKENMSRILNNSRQFPNWERIGKILKTIDNSSLNGVGGGGVCHYGCL